ncbi:MAG: hypothetical protein ACXADX_21290, partial [Candidatus Hodarchaeales archaeon]
WGGAAKENKAQIANRIARKIFQKEKSLGGITADQLANIVLRAMTPKGTRKEGEKETLLTPSEEGLGFAAPQVQFEGISLPPETRAPRSPVQEQYFRDEMIGI